VGVSFRGAQRIYCVGGYRNRNVWWCSESSLPVLPASIEIARKANAAYVFLLCFFSVLYCLLLLNNPLQYCWSRECNGAYLFCGSPAVRSMIAGLVMRFPKSAWHRSCCWNWLVLPTYISRGLWLETQLQCDRLRRSEAWLAARNATVVVAGEIEDRAGGCARDGGWDGEVGGNRWWCSAQQAGDGRVW
jgi:hypothetical protein